MEVKQDVRKFLVIGIAYTVLIILSHTFFSLEYSRNSQMEKDAEQLAEKFNFLIFSLSTSKNDQDFADIWKSEINEITTLLRQYPELNEVKRDLNDLDDVVSNRLDKTSELNSISIDNLDLIKNISRNLFLFAEEASKDPSRGLINVGELFVFLFLTSALVFYFFKPVENIRNPFLLLIKESAKEGQKEVPRRETSDVIGQIVKEFNELTGKNEKLQKVLKDLGEKKKIISQVIENLPIGFAVSKLVDKKILMANKEMVEIYGFRPDFLDEVNSYHVFPQEAEIAKEKGYPENISPADILMPQEKKGQIIFNRKGQYQTVDLKRIPIKKEGVLVTLITNVSELTEKEEELAASERISRFIFDTAEVGLSVVDEKGFIVRVNKTFCSIYGFKEEEIIGQPFIILVPGDKREHFKHAYKKRMNKMTSQASPVREVQVIKKNGEVLDVLTTSRSVFDHHFKGTIYSVFDVTEIRTDHGKLKAAVEGGQLGTWNINFNTGYNEINHHWAEMLGYKKAEVPPTITFFDSLIHPDDKSDFMREIEKIKKGEQSSFHGELRLRCKSGDYKWILNSGNVIKRNSKGEPVLMAGCHVDIDEMKKAQFEIVSHSDRLRRAQEMGMVGDWELDVNTGSFSCSNMIFRIFGRRKENTFSFEQFLNLFDSSYAQVIRRNIQIVISRKKVFSQETKVHWENGTSKYLKVFAVPVLGSNGKVTKVSGILQDITSIKTTRENLEETTQRLQVLSENIPGGLIQLRVGRSFPPQILYLSRGAEKIWGVSRDRALEGEVSVLFQHIHPNDHNVIKRSLQVASKRLERLNITWRTILNSGEIRWHHAIGIPAENEDNSVTWNALILDITERKVSENKIREQEEYMQVMTQHASDAIIACDQSGKIRFVNETIQNWIGPIDTTKPPKDWPRFYHIYSIENDRLLKASELSLFKAMETGQVINQEFLIKSPGKEVRYVQSNGSALYDSSGNSLGAMVVLRDITERVQKEVEVSNAIIKARERERAKIASEIHDGITQSLSVVAMNMKNLRFDYKELETSDNYAKALGYLQDVIEQSRTLSHEIMPNSIQDFGLVEALKELVEQCSTGSKKEINFEYTGFGRTTVTKELHIFRVIQEGLGNALKHSGANFIQIRLHFGKDHIRVSLKDDGKGFDPGKSYLNQGIGLLSMRDRVKKIKGRFRIFSGDRGTVVWLKVPINEYSEKNEKTNTNFYS